MTTTPKPRAVGGSSKTLPLAEEDPATAEDLDAAEASVMLHDWASRAPATDKDAADYRQLIHRLQYIERAALSTEAMRMMSAFAGGDGGTSTSHSIAALICKRPPRERYSGPSAGTASGKGTLPNETGF